MNTTVLFVVSNTWGSSMHRGYDMSSLLGASVVQCYDANVSASVDVMIHVKFPCYRLRATARHHIFDRVDNYHFDMARVPWMRTEIVPTHHMAQSCTHQCIFIPHHMNLNCSVHSDAWWNKTNPVIGIVGTDVRSKINLVSWSLLGYSVNYETMGHPCEFFNAIDVAVVWKKHDGVDIPVERLTNPIWFNIPTVAHSFHIGYTEYTHASPFLCDSLFCLRRMVQYLSHASNDLMESFALLRREVMNDVDVAHVVSLYKRMIAKVSSGMTNWTRNGVSYAPKTVSLSQ